MFWITLIFLLFMGALAAAPGWGRSNDTVRDAAKALRPVEGWIGLVGVAWGIWTIIYMLMNMGLIKVAAFFWFMNVLIGVLFIGLGFILGMGQLSALMGGKGGDVGKTLEAQHKKLAPRRHQLGVSALITAGLSLLLYILRV